MIRTEVSPGLPVHVAVEMIQAEWPDPSKQYRLGILPDGTIGIESTPAAQGTGTDYCMIGAALISNGICEFYRKD